MFLPIAVIVLTHMLIFNFKRKPVCTIAESTTVFLVDLTHLNESSNIGISFLRRSRTDAMYS